MISVEIHHDDDSVISRVWMRSVPRVGESLWFAGGSHERIKAEHGGSSFKVTGVAHWVTDEWSPNTHVGEPIHSVCVYVRKV